MKIALPMKEGKINRHFGKSTIFAMVEVEGKEIKEIKEFNTLNLVHQHEHLATLLQQHGVNVVIAGGMGLGAFIALKSRGMEVEAEVAGEIREVVNSYLAGKIEQHRDTKCDCSKGDCDSECSSC